MLLVLVLTLAQTVPSNITKVPRGDVGSVCSETQGITTLTAGQSYELVFFVDGPLRYRTLETVARWDFGLEFWQTVAVSDTGPVCLSGPNAGQRPHVMPLRLFARGIYTLQAVIRDDPKSNGTVIDRLRVTVQ